MNKLRDRSVAVAEELLLRNGSVSEADVIAHTGPGGAPHVRTWARRRRGLVLAEDRWSRTAPPPAGLIAIEPVTAWSCTTCDDTGDLMVPDGPLCLDCADAGHLVFVPSGNAALSRRTRTGSTLCYLVYGWLRDRRRFTRIGLLAEAGALERAEASCLADEAVRARRRERERRRRARADEDLTHAFADRIRELYPNLPPARARAIATHSAERGTGRVGRSSAGKALDATAVYLAVVAAFRHEDTDYDTLLMSGVPRTEARQRVQARIDHLLREAAPQT